MAQKEVEENPDNTEFKKSIIERLQKLAQKLGSLYGFVTTRQDDNTAADKVIIHNLEQTLVLLKSIKKTMNIYFMATIFLFYLLFHHRELKIFLLMLPSLLINYFF